MKGNRKAATGAEIRSFYHDHWPSGYYMDTDDGEPIEDENGAFLLKDDQDYDLSLFADLYREDGPARKFVTFADAFNASPLGAREAVMLTGPVGHRDAVRALVARHDAGMSAPELADWAARVADLLRSGLSSSDDEGG